MKRAHRYGVDPRHSGRIASQYVVVKSKRVGVVVKGVVCPDCKVGIGEACVSVTDGHPVKTPHDGRRRMATRLYNESDHPEPKPSPTVGKARVKGVCPECGAEVGTHLMMFGPRVRVVSQHRPGGGTYSPKHGGGRCVGTDQPPKEEAAS